LVPLWTTSIKAVGVACTSLLQAKEALTRQKQELGGQMGLAVRRTQAEDQLLKTNHDASKDAAARLKAATKAVADVQRATKDATATQDLKCDLSMRHPTTSGSAAPTAKQAETLNQASTKNELCDVLARLKKLEDFGVAV